MSANWDSLAIYLRFSTGETAAITANVGGSDGKVEFCFNRVIAAWLSGPRENVTRDVLAAAVRRSNFGNLADEIRDGMYVGKQNFFFGQGQNLPS